MQSEPEHGGCWFVDRVNGKAVDGGGSDGWPESFGTRRWGMVYLVQRSVGGLDSAGHCTTGVHTLHVSRLSAARRPTATACMPNAFLSGILLPAIRVTRIERKSADNGCCWLKNTCKRVRFGLVPIANGWTSTDYNKQVLPEPAPDHSSVTYWYSGLNLITVFISHTDIEAHASVFQRWVELSLPTA